MKILDAGCYGIYSPMINNKEQAEKSFVYIKACIYPPKGYKEVLVQQEVLCMGGKICFSFRTCK